MTTAVEPRPTVGDTLRRAVHRLAEAGIPHARREAQGLWAAVSGWTVGVIWSSLETTADPAIRRAFHRAVHRRLRGEPFAYAARSAAFRYLTLFVDGRVLIPRPETEGLVQCVLDWRRARGPARGGKAADIGTGSGCIALSLATEGAFDRVIGSDVSRGALAVAAVNVRRVSPAVPVELRHGTLFEPLGAERFDVIVSNPPYISPLEYLRLDGSVRCFEPRRALVAGDGGMEQIQALCRGAARHLVPGGLLALEVDARRGAEASRAARDSGLVNIGVIPDLWGRDRYLLAARPQSDGWMGRRGRGR